MCRENDRDRYAQEKAREKESVCSFLCGVFGSRLALCTAARRQPPRRAGTLRTRDTASCGHCTMSYVRRSSAFAVAATDTTTDAAIAAARGRRGRRWNSPAAFCRSSIDRRWLSVRRWELRQVANGRISRFRTRLVECRERSFGQGAVHRG